MVRRIATNSDYEIFNWLIIVTKQNYDSMHSREKKVASVPEAVKKTLLAWEFLDLNMAQNSCPKKGNNVCIY